LEVPFMRHAAIASSVLSLAAAGLLAGCPDRSISEVDPAQGRVEFKDIPVNVNRNIDILFMIDDSPSMGDKQTNLAANFPEFIKVLSTIPGGLPNVHIGVVTSDLGSKGADGMIAPSVGTCSGFGKAGNLQLFGAPVTDGNVYISDLGLPDGSRQVNYSGTLTDAFKMMANAGAGGCGFEQHLEAVKQALQPSNAANRTFLRDDAFLAVIIIADEDDCSMAHTTMLGPDSGALGPRQSFRCTQFGVLCDVNGSTPNAMDQVSAKSQCHPNDNSPYLTNVADYAKFLKGLKTDPSKVIVAGIMGTTEPFATELRAPPGSMTKIPALAHSCTYIGGDGKPEVADPPIRMKFFLDQFPNRSTFAPICQQDLSGGLQQIGDLLKTVIGDPCIEGKLADVDPTTAGPQYDCSVSTVAPGQEEKIMPQCPANLGAATDPPCWHLVTDPMSCPNSDHFTLTIERKTALVLDTHVIANCVTEVTNN